MQGRLHDFTHWAHWRKIAVITLIAYAAFWVGGWLSFNYTHNCVRSHTEESYNVSTQDTAEVKICDYYSANGKRWTLLDPMRVLIGFPP